MPGVLPLSLASRGPGRIRPDLERLRRALSDLGDPQHRFPSVLIVGTNGKGSTAVMLEGMLRRCAAITGLYTSPHLVSVTERIRVDGRMITDEALGRHLERLEAHPDLTFFETLTAVAFLEFAEQRVDVAILEAGMGGRWDATRLAESAVAGLTMVGTDHREWLGPTREAIAADKGAALAAAETAILGPAFDPALRGALSAPRARRASEFVELRRNRDSLTATWLDRGSTELTLPLDGAHQVHNLHLALALAEATAKHGWIRRPEPDDIARGVAATTWPGRLSRHVIGGREVVLDGAHNAEGAIALAAELATWPSPPSLLFSCLQDKPAEAMAKALRPVVGDVVICSMDDPRAMAAEGLRAAWPEARFSENPAAGLALCPEPVVATGSLRLVGALLELEDR
jgi:dihydrofolate synthase/folylpolyglutamate synthase